MNTRILLKYCLFVISFVPIGLSAQTTDLYRGVLVTDKTLTMAKLLSDQLDSGRYLLLTIRIVRAEKGKSDRRLSDDNYAIDCSKPKGVKVISMSINKAMGEVEPDNWFNVTSEDVPRNFKLQDLKYINIDKWVADANREVTAIGVSQKTPEALVVATEYACASAGLPAESRDSIAKQVSRSAMLTDISELDCKFSPNGDKSYSASVGFSDSRRFVRWNSQWMSDAYVRPTEIGFSSGNMKVNIDRQTGSITVAFGNLMGSGTCLPAPKQENKF